IVGLVQPWGEYMTLQETNHSPFAFADTLIRSGLNLGALELECVMGVTPRGNYCRDTLDVSRLLDLYALLGGPLQVTLGYPSTTAADSVADADLAASGGHWLTGLDAATQAAWASAVGNVALCKPAVRSVQWTHYLDGARHQFPGCGLVDHAGQPKPALQQ